MNKTIDFLQAVKFPVDTQVLADMMSAIEFLEQVLAKVASPNESLIISGCVVSNNTISDGIVYFDGKIMPFVGGTWHGPDYSAVDVTETPVNITADGDTYQVSKSYFAFVYNDNQAPPEAMMASFKRLHSRVKTTFSISATGPGYNNSMNGKIVITEQGSVTINATLSFACAQDPGQELSYSFGVLTHPALVDGQVYQFAILNATTVFMVTIADGDISIRIPSGNQSLVGTNIKATFTFNLYQ